MVDRQVLEFPAQFPPRSGSAGEILSGDPDLPAGLAGLAQLAAGNGSVALETMLTHVADFAVQAIPGADGAGVTLLAHDRPDTVVASAPFVRSVDAIQYAFGEGPCMTAVADRRTVRSGSVGRDREWPRFGVRCARLGVHSVLSLPLSTDDKILGSLNVYAYDEDTFDDRAAQLGELFAVPAAVSVDTAQSLAHARRLATALQVALNNRQVIDQAIGILMSRTGCTVHEAFDRLRSLSQAQNLKIAVLARIIVHQAVHRVRAQSASD